MDRIRGGRALDTADDLIAAGAERLRAMGDATSDDVPLPFLTEREQEIRAGRRRTRP